MFKKFISMILIICILILTSVQIQAYATVNTGNIEFSDIRGHWAESIIRDAARRGTITGFPDGTFRPNRNVNIDEFIKMIILSLTQIFPSGKRGWSNAYFDRLPRSMQYDLIATLDYFDPNNVTTTGHWADPYIDQARRMLFFNRNSPPWNNRLNRPITREEAVFILNTIISWKECEQSSIVIELALRSIRDRKDIADYQDYHIGHAIVRGILRGTPNGNFNPKRNITRAEALVAVNRITNDSLRSPFTPNLRGLHHMRVSAAQGTTRILIFPDREFLEVVDLLNKLKEKDRPGYQMGDEISLSYVTSREAVDEIDAMALRGLINEAAAKSREISIFGLGIRNCEYNNAFFISYTIGNKYSLLNEYREIYDAFIREIFESEAPRFHRIFTENINGMKNNRVLPPRRSITIDNREVELRISECNKSISVTISARGAKLLEDFFGSPRGFRGVDY